MKFSLFGKQFNICFHKWHSTESEISHNCNDLESIIIISKTKDSFCPKCHSTKEEVTIRVIVMVNDTHGIEVKRQHTKTKGILGVNECLNQN